MTIPATPKGLPVSPQQKAFLSGFTKATGLDANVSAAWLRNEEPAISQNTDPAGHGRYNFLNVGITDNKSYSAASPYWNDPIKAGQATGNWLAGRLSLPGYGKSSSGIQGITKTAGLTPAEQIRAIQQSGWASSGERALPSLYRQALGGGGIQMPTLPAQQAATPASLGSAPTGATAAPTLLSSLPTLQAGFGLQQRSNQSALDALGAISGRSVQAQAAPDLASLMPRAGTQPAAPAPKTITVPLKGTASHPGLDSQGQKALELARHYIGTKYVFGGESPEEGFDCSGLVQWANEQVGVKVPRTAAEQYQVGKHVGLNQLQPGDAVFFRDSSGIHHVGMYVGGKNKQFLQAPHTGDVVKISSLNEPYYSGQFAGGRRFS